MKKIKKIKKVLKGSLAHSPEWNLNGMECGSTKLYKSDAVLLISKLT